MHMRLSAIQLFPKVVGLKMVRPRGVAERGEIDRVSAPTRRRDFLLKRRVVRIVARFRYLRFEMGDQMRHLPHLWERTAFRFPEIREEHTPGVHIGMVGNFQRTRPIPEKCSIIVREIQLGNS